MDNSRQAYLARTLALCSLFQHIDSVSLKKILALFTEHTLERGTLLLSPNETNNYLYLVVDGLLSIHLSDTTTPPIIFLTTGDYAGEVSFIDHQNPSAYVVANQRSTVLRLHRRDLPKIYDITPIIHHNLLSILCGRIRSSNHSLQHSEQNAHIDSLTGIPNRRWLDYAFQRERKHCLDNQLPLCMIMLDVDHFKDYNDTHGHLAGDLVLQFSALLLREQLRPHDSIARFGGEEFVALLPDLNLAEAALVAERLRKCLASLQHLPNIHPVLPCVTISLGVAQLNADDQLSCILHKADQALYQAKQQGRNRVCVHAQK
ncbi:MAG TPA: GGDEF domain-containing protein [Gammaproteobacteria bacterium]|nr:GGDEF domain-containing protein [Gammaproteobacteria bacterium]